MSELETERNLVIPMSRNHNNARQQAKSNTKNKATTNNLPILQKPEPFIKECRKHIHKVQERQGETQATKSKIISILATLPKNKAQCRHVLD